MNRVAVGLALVVVALIASTGTSSAAQVHTVAKSAKRVRFVIRAAPSQSCKVTVRRGRKKKTVVLTMKPTGKRRGHVRLGGHGRVRYTLSCPDAHLFAWIDGAMTSILLADSSQVVALFPLTGTVVGLDASDSKIVWTQAFSSEAGKNGVYIANRDGSDLRQLYASPGRFDSQDGVLVGAKYYWLEGDAIARVDIETGVVEPAFIPLPPGDFDGLGAADGLAADSHFLYFASCGNNAIGRVGLDGTGLEKYFVLTGDCVQEVAVNSTSIYWPELALSGEVQAVGRASIDGTSPEPLWLPTFGGGQLGNYGVAANESHVFWVSGDSNAFGGRHYLGRAQTDGGDMQPRLITRDQMGIDIETGP